MKIQVASALCPLFIILGCGDLTVPVADSLTSETVHTKKIKQERTDIYSFTGSDSIPEEIMETLFDTAGNITLETYFDGTYTRVGGKRFNYVNGKLVSTVFLESFVYKETDTLIYDAEGKIAQQIKEISNNHIPLRRLQTWFINGKPSLKIEEDLLKEKINWKDTFQWTENGKLLEKIGYDGTNKVVFYSSTSYNENGDELNYKRYDKDKTLVKESSHSYDSTGKIQVYTEKPNGKPVLLERYTYNDIGKKIKLECFEEEKIPSRTYIYLYNDNGDLASVTRLDPEGKVSRKTYYTYENY